MNTLFELKPVLPEGFDYKENFVTASEQERLLAAIRTIDLHAFQFQGFEAKRRVASFGYDYSFDERALKSGKAIPEEFEWLVMRVAAYVNIAPKEFKELLITEYPVGAVINWHRDAPPFGIVAGISLLSPCVFKLRPQEKVKQTRDATRTLVVHPGSLYVMRDEARWDWQHSTAPVKKVRYSITLRTLKGDI